MGETDRKTTEGAARSARGFWVVGQQSSNIKPQRQQKYTSTNIVGSQQRDGGRRTGGAGERGLPSIGALSSINCVALHLKTKNLIFSHYDLWKDVPAADVWVSPAKETGETCCTKYKI